MKCLLPFLLVLVSLTASADSELYGLINQRLSLMKDVAAYKWHHQMPIEAPDREITVIDRAVLDGLKYGVTRQSATAFFRAQIEAAKDIQRCWFSRWQTGVAPPMPADLDDVVRPRLISLGSQITARLNRDPGNAEDFRHAVAVDCLSTAGSHGIFQALSGISTYPDRLTQILDSGLLRVGTTGDYAPFSHAEDGDAAQGIDIDLARAFAAALGVEPLFIRTSWPTLMADLRAGSYDIAMSGVSITPARQNEALFSAPYHIGGKTPIARCENVDRFSSIEQIDQPGVRIIVNPGGTNEAFIDGNIRRAEKVLHRDNRTIFEEIKRGKVDLMITDAIEVRLRSARDPSLCPTMPGATLSYQEKGYMMPRDQPLRAALNEWLMDAIASGLVEAVFERHLERHEQKPAD